MKIFSTSIRQAISNRVWMLESEKLYLQGLHHELGRQWRSIGDRIKSIDQQISAEKASAPQNKKDK
jgi:hypothetical protein